MILTKTFEEVFSKYNNIVENNTSGSIISPSIVSNGTFLISKLMSTDTLYVFTNSILKTVLDLTMAAAKTEEQQAEDQESETVETSKSKDTENGGLYPIAQEAGENIDTIKVSAMILRLNRNIKMKNNNTLFEVTSSVNGKTTAYRLIAVNSSMIAEKSDKDDVLMQKLLTLLNKNAEIVFKK